MLRDKEDEISKSKKQLRWAKEDAIKEYRDSDTVLTELGNSFSDGFDDCLHQVKASFSGLDLSHITIDAEGQTLAHPVDFEATDELFADDPTLEGDKEAAPNTDQMKSVEEESCPFEGYPTIEEKDGEIVVDLQYTLIFVYLIYIYSFF